MVRVSKECLLESGSYCTAVGGPESLVFWKTLSPVTLLTISLYDVNLCEYYVSVSWSDPIFFYTHKG